MSFPPSLFLTITRLDPLGLASRGKSQEDGTVKTKLGTTRPPGVSWIQRGKPETIQTLFYYYSYLSVTIFQVSGVQEAYFLRLSKK